MRDPSRLEIEFPTLRSFRWRVDVAISTSSLQRALRPGILVEAELSDGSLLNFEMTVEEFQDLRYNVARVLRDLEDLERAPIMNL